MQSVDYLQLEENIVNTVVLVLLNTSDLSIN